ncbi:MAG: addiction module protein [Candidatus Hydrogenedentes bacterium]|nr:addiction module protein [Candidatus Hydrogenedentota bacterium]
MNVTEDQIAQMSRAEKLQLMEALWVDLSRAGSEVESPDWHRPALEETESRLAAGEECVLDWDDAKRELWKRVR